MRECDNSKIHISSNILLSICFLIMLDTLWYEVCISNTVRSQNPFETIGILMIILPRLGRCVAHLGNTALITSDLAISKPNHASKIKKKKARKALGLHRRCDKACLSILPN